MKKLIIGLALSLSFASIAFAQSTSDNNHPVKYPYQQVFTITAYYSPIKEQKRYLRGTLAADKKLNGNGVHGADGTAVFPGMIASPKTFMFGTKMQIPGIGIVSVHDRGGAIIASADGTKHDRLDIWMGNGDSGLNRALAWGKRDVKVTVYGIDDSLPEKIDLSSLNKLAKELSSPSFEDQHFQMFRHDFGYGDQNPEIIIIKTKLKKLGYFDGTINNKFDEPTYNAIVNFQMKYQIIDSSSDFGAGYFGPQTRKALERVLNGQNPIEIIPKINHSNSLFPPALADKLDSESKLIKLAGNGLTFLKGNLKPGDNGQAVIELQTELRKINFFGLDPNGNYGKITTHAIFKFQQSQKIVNNEQDLGAGIFGPQTRKRLAELVASRIESRQKQNQKTETLVTKK